MRRNHVFLALAAAAALLPGCAQLDVPNPLAEVDVPDPLGWLGIEEKPEVPTKVVVFWTDAVRHQAGRAPERGFGGRLFFYKGDEPRAIRVRGTLTVYAFDEHEGDPLDPRPDRKYVILPDQLAKLYSKSPELGHSYSVWLPWDQVGGPTKEISLIVRFVPEQGDVVISEPTRQLLPGTPTKKKTAAKDDQRSDRPDSARSTSAIQQTVYHAEDQQHTNADEKTEPAAREETPAELPRRLHTTTIPIPRSFGRLPTAAPRRNASGPQASAPQDEPAQQPPEQQDWARQRSRWLERESPRPPRARFSLPKPRALGEPIARPTPDHARWQRPPVTSPSSLQRRLPPATGSSDEGTAPEGPSAAY